MALSLIDLVDHGRYLVLVGSRRFRITVGSETPMIIEADTSTSDVDLVMSPYDGADPAADWSAWRSCRAAERIPLLPIAALEVLVGLPLLEIEHPAVVIQIAVVMDDIEVTPLMVELANGCISRWSVDVAEEAELIGRISLATLLRWLDGDEELSEVIPQTADEYVVGRVGDLLLAAGLLDAPFARAARRPSPRERSLAALAGCLLDRPQILSRVVSS